MQVSEIIPKQLSHQVEAAVDWFNDSNEAAGETFKVTGILDADEALGGSEELKLILCGGDRCEQRAFRVTGAHGRWTVTFSDYNLESDGEGLQADLDPPPGVRRQWLDNILSQHAFVVLLFYRGFW